MRQYRHRYDQTRSFRRVVRIILMIGVFLGVLVFGMISVTDFIEEQHLQVTKTEFSDLEKKQFSYEYGFVLADDLSPAYEFLQGFQDDAAKYEGVVLDIRTDIGNVLEHCMGLSPDSDQYLKIYHNCKDYFIDGDYNGQVESMRTDDGKKKAIHFSVDGFRYQFYIYEISEGTYQLMARKET